MTYRDPARTAARRTRSTILAASVVVSAALIGVAASPIDIRYGAGTAVIGIDSAQPTGDPEPAVIGIYSAPPTTEDRGQHDDHDRRDRRAPALPLGEADGVVPDGLTVTVFDDGIPAVANLDADLLGALRQAATDAADDGVELSVTSGWRSPEYQDQLLREAIATYGSEDEAARWVATADTSAHVSGDAVDIGPSDAMAWLSEHGAGYGLCQIYINEPWHFELRPEAIADGCPPMYADPTHDPGMQRRPARSAYPSPDPYRGHAEPRLP
jgi:zinc D-Ala-D-Ala carboxypeptidase